MVVLLLQNLVVSVCFEDFLRSFCYHILICHIHPLFKIVKEDSNLEWGWTIKLLVVLIDHYTKKKSLYLIGKFSRCYQSACSQAHLKTGLGKYAHVV